MTLKFSGKTALFAGLAAAAGASACCIGPLVLLAFGIGGAWAGGFAALEQYRFLFVPMTFVFLGLAYRQLYARRLACDPDVPCAEPRSVHFRRLLFWVIAGLSLALVLFPYIATKIYVNNEENEAVNLRDSSHVSSQTIILKIDNMTCEVCAASVRKALNGLQGVHESRVNVETRLARITFDPVLVSRDELTKAIERAGYPSSMQKDVLP
ncbi:hypothetical protein GC163_24405 [bacterium]|nr:hypothetical protein [bacterium]